MAHLSQSVDGKRLLAERVRSTKAALTGMAMVVTKRYDA